MVYYIAGEETLPLIPPQKWDGIDTAADGWQSKVVPFSVEALDDSNKMVGEKFAEECVRYAGSFEGCGCGFRASVFIDEDAGPPGDHELAGRSSREHLHQYVLKHRVSSLYVCWSGDEAQPAKNIAILDPNRIIDFTFAFEERCLYRIAEDLDWVLEPSD